MIYKGLEFNVRRIIMARHTRCSKNIDYSDQISSLLHTYIDVLYINIYLLMYVIHVSIEDNKMCTTCVYPFATRKMLPGSD